MDNQALFALVDTLLAERGSQAGKIPEYTQIKAAPLTAAQTIASEIFPPRICVLNDVVEGIGATPMVSCTRLAARYGLKCRLLAKLEYMSSGGSVKDRIAREMLAQAEHSGQVRPGDLVIEATSGNTGIGLALICAVRGYRCVIVMPKKMSAEKANVLQCLGVKLVRTPTSAAWDHKDSHLSVAYWLKDALNARGDIGCKAVCLDQYKHAGNLTAHFHGTAEEILAQTNRNLQALVATAGTGGTLSGIALKVKQVCPDCRIVGVDPEGSILHCNNWDATKDIKPYEVEGIGYDFHPSTFRPEVVDEWVIAGDRAAFLMAREAIRYEGLLCGGSSGAALFAAVRVGKGLTATDSVVVVLPDSIRNYINKFVNDDWMLARQIFQSPAEHADYRPTPTPFPTSTATQVTSSTQVVPPKQVATEVQRVNSTSEVPLPLVPISWVADDQTVAEALAVAKKQDVAWVLILNACSGGLRGALSRDHLGMELLKGEKATLVNDLVNSKSVHRLCPSETPDKTALVERVRVLMLALEREKYAQVAGGGVIFVVDDSAEDLASVDWRKRDGLMHTIDRKKFIEQYYL